MLFMKLEEINLQLKAMRRGFKRRFEPLRILTDSQVEYIHTASLDILENTGVKFESKRALNLLEKSGCSVDYENRVSRFPPYLVEDSIRKAPGSFYVKARIADDDLMFGGNTLYFMPAAGAKLHDEKTGDLTVATIEENHQVWYPAFKQEFIQVVQDFL